MLAYLPYTMLKNGLKIILFLITVVIITYFLGPKVAVPNLDNNLPVVTKNLMQLEKQIRQSENTISNIKPDNEARIIWADSIPKKTPYSIVYLHGWSASQEEGDPIHEATAKRYGCNLYLPRLAHHGLAENDNFKNITAKALYDSAKEAIAIAQQLGEKVIVMATSTGATLALPLANDNANIAALILYSPNIAIFDPTATLLTKNWGLKIAQTVTGGVNHEFEKRSALIDQYWTPKYRLEGLVQLQALIDATMNQETFNAVRQPVFLGYYYKDEVHQDSTVSVPAMLKMYQELGTPTHLKVKKAFPKAADHVIASYITSKDVTGVQKETFKFIEDILGLKPRHF